MIRSSLMIFICIKVLVARENSSQVSFPDKFSKH